MPLTSDAALAGVPLIPSPYVREGQLVQTDDAIYFHSRQSVRARRRRPHGRTNGPKRWKVRRVTYQPDFDRLVAALRGDGT